MRDCKTLCDVCRKVLPEFRAPITVDIYDMPKVIWEGGDFCSWKCADEWLDGLRIRVKSKSEKKSVMRRVAKLKALMK